MIYLIGILFLLIYVYDVFDLDNLNCMIILFLILFLMSSVVYVFTRFCARGNMGSIKVSILVID